jgi:hypothetical protein
MESLEDIISELEKENRKYSKWCYDADSTMATFEEWDVITAFLKHKSYEKWLINERIKRKRKKRMNDGL